MLFSSEKLATWPKVSTVHSHISRNYIISKHNYRKLGHCYKSHADKELNTPFALLVANDDNSCIVLNPKNG